MKKIFLKSAFSAIVFFGIGIIMLYIAKARSGTTATAGDKLTAAKWNELVANLSGTQSQLSTLQTTVSALNSIPAGSVVAFNSSTCPTGRKPADGTNSTVDLRGEFIRGFDNGRGVDSGRTLGSLQKGTPVLTDNEGATPNVIEGIESVDGSTTRNTLADTPETYSSAWFRWIGTTIGVNTASINYTYEFRPVRPRNIALLYCVKN